MNLPRDEMSSPKCDFNHRQKSSLLVYYVYLCRNVAEEMASLWRVMVDAKERVLPPINLELCNGCGICVDTCLSEAMALIDGSVSGQATRK